ncbi:hypothetical protein DICA3_A02322 [Diutina catenulata]
MADATPSPMFVVVHPRSSGWFRWRWLMFMLLLIPLGILLVFLGIHLLRKRSERKRYNQEFHDPESLDENGMEKPIQDPARRDTSSHSSNTSVYGSTNRRVQAPNEGQSTVETATPGRAQGELSATPAFQATPVVSQKSLGDSPATGGLNEPDPAYVKEGATK